MIDDKREAFTVSAFVFRDFGVGTTGPAPTARALRRAAEKLRDVNDLFWNLPSLRQKLRYHCITETVASYCPPFA